MRVNKLIGTLALGLALAVISGSAALAGDQAAEFQAAIEKAEESRKKAASVGGEWRDTGSMIKEAKALAAKGDYQAALNLANDAFRQGELGYQQAMQEKDAGFPAYMR
jgi:hypothetical protein